MTRALLRRLYLRVHPDLFEKNRAAQRVNEASFKSLQALLQAPGGGAAAADDSALRFFVAAEEPDAPLRRVEARVRNSTLDADLRELLRRCDGHEPREQAATSAATSRGWATSVGPEASATEAARSRASLDAWWRARRAARDGRARPCSDLRDLLTRHAAEARRRSAAAAEAQAELTAGLHGLRDEYGVHVRFEPTLRCSLTKRRLLTTLRWQLQTCADMRGALGGGGVAFTNGEPGPAAAATAASRAEAAAEAAAAAGGGSASSAACRTTFHLSTMDTPSGWRSAVCEGRSGRSSLDAAATAAVLRSAASASGAEAVGNSGGATALRSAEERAASALGVRSLRPQSASLRHADGYAPFLGSLASAAVREALRPDGGGRWGSAAAAAGGWRAIVTPFVTLRPLRVATLRPRQLWLRLPLGCDVHDLCAMLNGDGASLVAEAARARSVLGQATSTLGLRGLRADEALEPAQISAACEGLLRRAAELRALGCEGTVLQLGSSGFAMAEDGALRVGWDATGV